MHFIVQITGGWRSEFAINSQPPGLLSSNHTIGAANGAYHGSLWNPLVGAQRQVSPHCCCGRPEGGIYSNVCWSRTVFAVFTNSVCSSKVHL